MKRLLIGGLAAFAIAGPLVGSGTANASELSFLQVLNDSGLNVYDAATTVNSGYLICAHLQMRAQTITRNATGQASEAL